MPLQHPEPDVWRNEAGQKCLRLTVLKSPLKAALESPGMCPLNSADSLKITLFYWHYNFSVLNISTAALI